MKLLLALLTGFYAYVIWPFNEQAVVMMIVILAAAAVLKQDK